MRFAHAALPALALATLAGCSSSPPPSPDGAFSVTTTQDDPEMCMIAGNTASVGDITPQNRLMVVTDGTNGTKVDCSVSGMGTFAVNATLDDTPNTDSYLQIVIPAITTGATESAPVTGNGSFSATFTAGNPLAGTCNFWFTPPETVAEGKVWVSFSCPGLVGAAGTCPLTVGTAIFENCDTTAAM
jgi:hypothetical protein